MADNPGDKFKDFVGAIVAVPKSEIDDLEGARLKRPSRNRHKHMPVTNPKRYRRSFSPSESHRVTETEQGTHEFNLSTEAPEAAGFWEFSRNVLSKKGASREHRVTVGVTIGATHHEVVGRVYERLRKDDAGDLQVTEYRFKPLDKATANALYAGLTPPAEAIVVVTKSDEPGIDYEYEVVLPTDASYGSVALAQGEREVYD